jgi:hypothetical protein
MFAPGPLTAASTVAYVSLFMWFATALLFLPSAVRYTRRYNLLDAYRTGIFFMAMLWFGGLSRLLFLPHAENVRLAILAMSCAVAGYLIVLGIQGRVK